MKTCCYLKRSTEAQLGPIRKTPGRIASDIPSVYAMPKRVAKKQMRVAEQTLVDGCTLLASIILINEKDWRCQSLSQVHNPV